MKKSMIFTTAIIVLLAVTFIGCNGGDDSSSSAPAVIDSKPEINSVLTMVNGENATYKQAHIGDELTFFVTFTDGDKDLRSLVVEYYFEDELINAEEFPIPPFENVKFNWEFTEDIHIIDEPLGFQHVVMYAVDTEGNESNDYEFDIVVKEALPIPPTVMIAAYPTSGSAPLEVSFTSHVEDDGTIEYVWEFGDGEVADGMNITHTYSTLGIYIATLTVTDDDGLSASENITITVEAPPAK